MHKRTMAILALSGAEGLRNKSIQTDEKSPAEESQNVNKNATEADRGNGRRAVGQAADHHRVHNGHTHPAEFGKNERDGQSQSRAEFGTQGLESSHGRRAMEKSVSGLQKRGKQ